ncbi:MAG: DUF4355 domain-containing protein [Oscillospiraceae bacterium]|nr:DUF4355 domain-containing protein [Oscillospiraceae bacterium]
MEFSEIIAELKKFEGTEEFNNYVNGLMNADRVKAFLATDDGKKLMQPQLDSYFSKGLETWKTNNLQGLIDAKVKEMYPDADPKDTELAGLKAELERMKAEALRKDLTNKALTIATEKGLPVDLVQFFVGADEKSTIANMETLEKSYGVALGAAVEKKLKDSNYTPPKGDDKPVDGVTAAFMNRNPGLQF